jgi:hypothetical protein
MRGLPVSSISLVSSGEVSDHREEIKTAVLEIVGQHYRPEFSNRLPAAHRKPAGVTHPQRQLRAMGCGRRRGARS